jgi:hypothetical protein
MRYFVLLACAAVARGLDNGAARTPPMGWSTWNKLRCKFNATVLLDVAAAMNSSGMVIAGYTSLNIDDCWPTKARDAATGDIVPDPAKFPGGMASFSASLARRGLGLGIYTAHGAKTCQGFPGSLGHEAQDAASYASWGVSFVKNDWCWHNQPNQSAHLAAFAAMRDALNATGTRMVHSVHWNYGDTTGPGGCAHGADCPLPDVANMWRIGGDINAGWGSVLKLIDTETGHAAAAGPGRWNDADMLEVGNGMSADQDRAHFSMWCALASPLIAGNDPRTMSEATRATLTNAFAIAVNQDGLGRQAVLVPPSTMTTPPLLPPRRGDAAPRYATAFVAACSGGKEQNWRLDAGAFLRREAPGGTCLDLYDCDTAEGARVGVWACTNRTNACHRDNDHWSFGGDGSTVRNSVRGACLTVASSGQVVASTCVPGDAAQAWKLAAAGGTFAPLVHAQSGRCLTAPPTPSPPPTPTPPPPPTPPPAAPTQVWAKPLASGAVAIVLLNRGKAPANITADFAAIEAATGLPLRVYDVLDIWANETSLGVMASQVTAHVAGTSAAFYKLVPKE